MFNLQNYLLRRKSALNVSLDVGAGAFKIVELSKKDSIVKLNNFIIQPIGNNANLPQQIKESFLKHSIATNNVNVSLPTNEVILRFVNMPRMNREELESSVRLEASKFLPLSLDKISLDVDILNSECPDNKMFVLIAAVKKETVEQKIKFFTDCGLTLKTVDVDSLALVNAFKFLCLDGVNAQQKDKKESIAILDIGASLTRVSILQNGFLSFTRAISFAADELDKRISTGLKVSPEKARAIKENMEKENTDELKGIVIEFTNELLEELQICFDYFESHFNDSLKRIFLFGGGAGIVGLKDTLCKTLGIDVITPDISAGIIFDEKIKDISNAKLNPLAVALGLGLRDD